MLRIKTRHRFQLLFHCFVCLETGIHAFRSCQLIFSTRFTERTHATVTVQQQFKCTFFVAKTIFALSCCFDFPLPIFVRRLLYSVCCALFVVLVLNWAQMENTKFTHFDSFTAVINCRAPQPLEY